MTDIYGNSEKKSRMKRLFQFGIVTIEKEGWKVERIKGAGKSSVRRITRNGESKVACIRTTQDRWIAFPRTKDDQAWLTLSDVNAVIAVSVDDKHNPQFAQVHMFEAADIRDRFDRAYAARMANNYSIPVGRGIWVSLYEKEDPSAPLLVGAGAGLASPMIAKVPLEAGAPDDSPDESEDAIEAATGQETMEEEAPLTIPEAKRRLALTLGVEPSNIKITVVDV